jgi:hypothetical protein
MPHELTWSSAGQVLHLDLRNSLSLEELKQLNREIEDILDGADRQVILWLDMSALKVGYHTADHLRSTQLYRDHAKLDAIVAVASSKLNRLVTLLAFHLSRPRFVQFDDAEQAQSYVTRLSSPGRRDARHLL